MSHPPTTLPLGSATGSGSSTPEPAATAEWDLVADRVHWSPDAFRLLARNPALGPLTLDQLPSQLVPQDRPALCRLVTAALVHGRPVDGVVRIRPAAAGAPDAVRCEGRPVLGPDGQVVSLRMLLRAA